MRRRADSCSGNALIEFVLAFPLLFLLLVNVVNFGGLFYAAITVATAARSGATYMTMGGASAGGPALPNPTAVVNVVRADLSALPNATDPKTTIAVCSNNYATGKNVASSPETCLPPNDPATGAVYRDPEPTTSVVATVRVSYTYCPFIPSWEFPALGIHSTLPSCAFSSGKISGGGTTLTRVAVMRMLQ